MMDHRRKAATYGKSARKPTFNPTFAEVEYAPNAEPVPWERTLGLYDKKPRPDHISTSAPTRTRITKEASMRDASTSDLSRPAAKGKQTTRPYAAKSPAVSNGAPKATAIYDFPSSDSDKSERDSRAIDQTASKRRKITPQAISEEQPLVYDDVSLQRHIATEVGNIDAQKLRIPGRGASDVQLPTTSDTSKTLKAEVPAQAKKRYATTKEKKPRTEKLVCLDGSGGIRTSSSKHTAPASTHMNTTPKVNAYYQKIHSPNGISSKATALLKKPKTFHIQDALQSSGIETDDVCLHEPDEYRLKTPPNPTRAEVMTTTPRQSELWSKPLTNEARNTSPSRLDLPGSRTTAQKATATQRQPVGDHFSRAIDQKRKDVKTKPKRIIDNLYPFGRHESPSYSETDNESTSSIGSARSLLSETSALDAITLQTSPSADSQNRNTQSQDHGSSVNSQPAPLVQPGGLKVTYAQQRSYLTDSDIPDTAMFSIHDVPEPNDVKVAGHQGFGVVMPKSQSHKSRDDGFIEVQDSQSNAMRSVHELREAGGNVRLVGELEAVLDDLNDKSGSSASIRRSSLLDLATRLQDPSICRLIIDHDLEGRFLSRISSQDIITNSLFAAVALQLLSSSAAASLLSEVSDLRIKKFFIDLLPFNQDVVHCAKLREHNMSRVSQQEFVRFCNWMLRSICWRAGKPSYLSCQVLAVQCLEYLVRQTREAGSVAEILSADLVSRLVNALLPTSISLERPVTNEIVCIELTVSILESCTISSSTENSATRWTQGTLERIISILPLLVSWREEELGTLQTLTLRLYLNMTNNTPRLCEAFARSDIISALFSNVFRHFEQLSDDKVKHLHPVLLDTVILSLGCLINLAESSGTMRRLITQDTQCGIDHLDALMELFMTRRQRAGEVLSEEGSMSNVAFGYASVLLSYLCLNHEVKVRVCGRLQGGTLKHLIDAVEEFLHFHRQIEDESQREDVEGDVRACFISRLQVVVDELKD